MVSLYLLTRFFHLVYLFILTRLELVVSLTSLTRFFQLVYLCLLTRLRPMVSFNYLTRFFQLVYFKSLTRFQPMVCFFYVTRSRLLVSFLILTQSLYHFNYILSIVFLYWSLLFPVIYLLIFMVKSTGSLSALTHTPLSVCLTLNGNVVTLCSV